ncbi:MarC family protein [Campylobacter lari]|uniref:MarC family protein n=1 Tax=Campylobacter lari TaxID=201 RepID=UPI0021F6B3AD|nr:MarC family protein [Campylobacter lari]MCW0240365.1 MarC family protein [Campylobacter lari]
MFSDIESEIYIILLASVAIIAVLNPFGNLPQFIAMTEGLDADTRKKLFRNIIYTAFCIVLVFLLSGPFIMKYLFKIDINDLRVAGGLILIIMSTKNLLFTPSSSQFQHYQGLSHKELLKKSIVPMAFPMLVGPGTLSTVVVISEDQNLAIASVLLTFAFIFALFHFSATIEKVIGKLVLYVFSRIALVFIMAMGVKMIAIGVQTYIQSNLG